MPEENKAPEKVSDVVTVSQDTLDDFNSKTLGLPTAEEAAQAEVVEPETSEGEIETTAEVEEPETEAEEEKPKAKKKNGFQERISELNSEKKAAQEEAARERAEAIRLRQEIDALKKQANPEPEPQTPIDDGKPKQEDFKEWADYVEALSDWKVDQKFKVREAQEAQQKAEQIWQDKVNAARAELPDYDEVIKGAAEIVLPNAVLAAIGESDIGPKLQHHLATNPDVIAKLSKLSITSQVKEIGVIEASLNKSAPQLSEKPAPKISSAPAPISSIKGTTTFENKVDSDGNFHGTPEEFKALRLAGKIK